MLTVSRVVIYMSMSTSAQGKQGTDEHTENKSWNAEALLLRIPDAPAPALSILTSQESIKKVTFRMQHFNSSAGSNTLISLTFTDHLVRPMLQILSCRKTKLRKEKTNSSTMRLAEQRSQASILLNNARQLYR